MGYDLIPVSDRVILAISTTGFLAIGVWLYVIFISGDDAVKVRRRRVFDAVANARRGDVIINREQGEEGQVLHANETRAQRRARDRRIRRRGIGQDENNNINNTLVEDAIQEEEIGGRGAEQEEIIDDDGQENVDDTNMEADQTMVMTRRDRIRAAKRSEREQRRRFEEERRQELQQKKIAEEEAYREWLYQKKDAAERERKQEERRLKAIQEKEERTYNQWKSLFTVIASGTACNENGIIGFNDPNFLENFAMFIKDRKVVPLTVLGRNFNNMSMEETLKVITTLEKTGQINGIVDAHGNYIYIDPKEVDRIINHIHLSGRVSTTDLSGMLLNDIFFQAKKT